MLFYGLCKLIIDVLRAHEGGWLKSQTIGGVEYLLYFYEGGWIKFEFEGLSVVCFGQILFDRFDSLFVIGSDMTNS